MPSDRTKSKPRLLIVDADRVLARSMADALRADAADVRVAEDAAAADAGLAAAAADVLLVDPAAFASCDAASGWIVTARRASPAPAVVVLASHPSAATAAALTRAGAGEYLTKPAPIARVREALGRATSRQRLLDPAEGLGPDARGGLAMVLGRDRAMRRVFDLVDAVAGARSTVLIVGESGTGKSLLARAIHARSPRAGRPFVELSCGSLPETLLEGELFGHIRGAFTGAHADKRGRFAAADGGTIFLDEVNSASPLMQVKLLRVLQEHAFEPVGSDETRTVDARVMLATNVDLAAMVAAGTFRQDLFYRVNVVTIALPPLRERTGDVQTLAEHFLAKHRAANGRQTIGFSAAAMAALRQYAWPGNVRELENAVERAVVLGRRPTVEVDDLPASVASCTTAPAERRAGDAPRAALPLEVALRGPERLLIEAALRRNDGARAATARELGIDRTTLYKKMRKLGLGGRDAA